MDLQIQILCLLCILGILLSSCAHLPSQDFQDANGVIWAQNNGLGNPAYDLPSIRLKCAKEASQVRCFGDCTDGWERISYYDSSIAQEVQIRGFEEPEQVRANLLGRRNLRECLPCENSYYLPWQGKVSCEGFYSTIIRINQTCKGCVRAWAAGCC